MPNAAVVKAEMFWVAGCNALSRRNNGRSATLSQATSRQYRERAAVNSPVLVLGINGTESWLKGRFVCVHTRIFSKTGRDVDYWRKCGAEGIEATLYNQS